MITYLDTSAALKLIIEEAESEELAEWLSSRETRLVSSMLLFTELHCAADRRHFSNPEAVNQVLGSVALVDLSREDLLRAGTSSWGLRAADVIHLACALRVSADEIVSYDRELSRAAASTGMDVRCPQ